MPSFFEFLGVHGRACICAALASFTLAAAACTPRAGFTRPPRPTAGTFDPARVADIDVHALPIIPEISAATRANIRDTFARGRAAGLDAGVFSKLGDCMTENAHFLAPFGDGDFDLASHASLAPIVTRFSKTPARSGKNWSQNSFSTPSLAAAGGFNVAAPLDPTWSNPEWCSNSESPLQCEFRVAHPSVVVLMFGTNDIAATSPADFDYYLRTLVHDSLDAGVVPLLSTFPQRPEDPKKTLLLNRIVIAVAREYQAPVMNLFGALEALPGRGVDPNDTIHLSVPPDGRTDILDDAHLRFGFTMRNLVTLQALNAVVAEFDPAMQQ
ncbi:MAG: SGNH/GDSL hydrolase family protein [Chloroflexi bacterium]|nr:SGNH/GDSL hydrolase family protein [Chloroflexota bacterium]